MLNLDTELGLCTDRWVVLDRVSKGFSKFGPGALAYPSVRWGQKQGILGHRPAQKSGRPGVGIMRSVCEAFAHSVLVKGGRGGARNGPSPLR